MRWKKEEALSGLARVGAGPRDSTLRDGEKRFASVYAIGGGCRGPVTGWFWVCPTDAVGEYKNTCNEPAPDEATAKAQAMAFIKKKLKVSNV